jgi:hypothetical protein
LERGSTVHITIFTKQKNTCRHEKYVTVEPVTGGPAPEGGRHRRRRSFHAHITAIDIYVCKHCKAQHITVSQHLSFDSYVVCNILTSNCSNFARV